jgi:exodeoxyribonuclease V alpha subunit
MTEHTEFLRELFPEAEESLVRLFASAAENADLLHTDFYTIRDLLDLSCYSGPTTLHVLLLTLLLALEEGSLCVEASPSGLKKRLADLVGDHEAGDWAERLLADLHGSGFPEVLGMRADENKPVIVHSRGDKQFLYFQKYFHHERVFQDSLNQRLQVPALATDLGAFRAALQAVLVERPLQAEGRPLQLDERQQLALGLALLRNLALISGGPGTGKTSIVLTLLRCFVRCGFVPERIALAAPTGRAAQRLTDAVRVGLDSLGELPDADACLRDLNAQTLHHLLSYHPRRGIFGRHVENPIPADVVIVDEVSMVGLVLMSQLLQALKPTTKLILLGDKDQLPSVEAGAVLANLVPDGGQPAFGPELRAQLEQILPDLDIPAGKHSQDILVILEENYRSQPAIRAVARAINRQEVEIVDRLPVIGEERGVRGEGRSYETLAARPSPLAPPHGCWLLPQTQGNVQELRFLLEQWAELQYLEASPGQSSYHELVSRCAGLTITEQMLPEHKDLLDQLFQSLARSRLLTLVREGPWGCVDINRFLDQYLRQRWDRFGRGGLFAGAPVLITRNDHVRQLYNGDVGVTLRGPGGGLRVLFPRQGGYAAFAAEALPAHELGFALTVHKSQGSEYGQVLLILPPAGGKRLLTKEMVYTGTTRAKKVAVVCATKEALRLAISRKIERESGLLSEV